MANLQGSRTNYPKESRNAGTVQSAAQQLCFIVGIACLAGFLIDTLALGLPPQPFELQWRIGFLQRVGDRSIVLLFGSALVLYSQLSNRRLAKPMSLVLLGLGVAFTLSCLLIIRDSLILQEQALNNISSQSEEIQAQIEETRQSPELPPGVTTEEFEEAERQVISQADLLKQNAKSGITRAGLASIGNLLVVGLSLIGLGRFGLVSAKWFSRG